MAQLQHFVAFFSAVCKASATCNPDIQGSKHVESDLTCKGMWGCWASGEPVYFNDPLAHATHLKFLSCLQFPSIASNWNQNLRGDFILATGTKNTDNAWRQVLLVLITFPIWKGGSYLPFCHTPAKYTELRTVYLGIHSLWLNISPFALTQYCIVRHISFQKGMFHCFKGNLIQRLK